MTYNDWVPLCSLARAGIAADVETRRHFVASCVGKPFVDHAGRPVGTVVGARIGDDGETLIVHVEPLATNAATE